MPEGLDMTGHAGSPVPNEAHEALCRRCGRCCFHKLLIGDTVVYTDVPCPYLDIDSRLCRVYEKRHEVNPDCLTVEEGIKRGVFPADCPYVKGLAGYRAPIEDTDPELLKKLLAESGTEEVAT